MRVKGWDSSDLSKTNILKINLRENLLLEEELNCSIEKWFGIQFVVKSIKDN